MGSRSVLARALRFLSQFAIRKHGMKIMVVAGSHGTKLTGELIAEMLSPDYVVRRQLEKPFWDLSIPLAVLGVEDRRYNFLEWPWLLVVSCLRLLFCRCNFTWTILQMNTFKPEIADYWLEILEPEVSVFVHASDDMESLQEKLVRRTKRVVISFERQVKVSDAQKSARIYTIGFKKENDAVITSLKETVSGMHFNVEISKDKKSQEFFAFQRGEFMVEPVMLSVATLLSFNISPEEVSEKLKLAEVPVDRFILSARSADVAYS